jgi:hypothetical protein
VVGHEPRRLENAERLVVDGAGPRRRVPLRPALYDGHLQAGLAEEDCGQKADRAAADDDAVDRRRAGQRREVVANGWCCRVR